MGKLYRMIESYPEDGTRHGKRAKSLFWIGESKDALKQAVDRWCDQRKPWAEYRMYHGSRRIYAYEL